MAAYLKNLGRTGHHDRELADLVGRASAAHVRGLEDRVGHLTAMAGLDTGRDHPHMRTVDLTRVTQRAVEAVRLDDMDLPHGVRPDLFPHLYYGAIANQPDVPGPDHGLAVAKKILDAHHATVAPSDRPGDGTSLHVFPFAECEPERDAVHASG
jgi:nitrogen-specific signal transduction histidine kinase